MDSLSGDPTQAVAVRAPKPSHEPSKDSKFFIPFFSLWKVAGSPLLSGGPSVSRPAFAPASGPPLTPRWGPGASHPQSRKADGPAPVAACAPPHPPRTAPSDTHLSFPFHAFIFLSYFSRSFQRYLPRSFSAAAHLGVPGAPSPLHLLSLSSGCRGFVISPETMIKVYLKFLGSL